MRRVVVKWVLGVVSVAGVGLAQQPVVPMPVVPAVNVVPAAKAVAPIDRFLADPNKFPEPTMQAVYSARAGSDWLCRMTQPDGRFRAGFNPTLSLWLDDDNDVRQAAAAVALSRSAAFTGDAKISALASQSALALFTMTKEDPAGKAVRIPLIASDRGNKVAFAALTALAVYELPAPDAKLLAKADELCAFLRKQVKQDGSVAVGDDMPTAAVPGLAFQAVMASDRWKPEQWKRDVLANGVTHYRAAFKQTPSAEFAGAMLPAVVDFCLRVKGEAGVGFAFEMADRLCDAQFAAGNARSRRWIGGFKTGTGEPTAESLPCAAALAAATQLAVQVPDAARFAKYRAAAAAALAFGRSLQLTAENTRQFDKGYAALYLVGGACGGPSDGCVRAEPTADLIAAQLRFLSSGGERGE